MIANARFSYQFVLAICLQVINFAVNPSSYVIRIILLDNPKNVTTFAP